MAVTLERTTKRFIGLSTDDKPTGAPPGSSFLENDTGRVFRYDGHEWRNYQPADEAIEVQKWILAELAQLRMVVELAVSKSH